MLDVSCSVSMLHILSLPNKDEQTIVNICSSWLLIFVILSDSNHVIS